MAKADGSVIISTELDNSGIAKGVEELNSQLEGIEKKAKETGQQINNAFSGQEGTSKAPEEAARTAKEAAETAESAKESAQDAVSTAKKASEAAAETAEAIRGNTDAVGGIEEKLSGQNAQIQAVLNDTERSAKSKAESIAAIYRKQGMSQQEAFKKAWEQIERDSASGAKQVTRSVEGIGGAAEEAGKDIVVNIGDRIKNTFEGFTGTLRTMASALAAVFSISAIVQFGKESSAAARELSDALTGLRSILEGQGRSFSQAQAFIEEYTQDGLVPASNAITAYKNLAARGYDDSQIKQVMAALKDASAYGRQASYTMGEAVQSATEGLKNENSILVDNAGVTKNVAKMWEEYAASIGTTSNNLTQQQKIQAEVMGILEESKYQAGDAAKVADTLSGRLQQLSFNFTNLKVAVGGIVNPIVQAVLPAVNSAVAALTRMANAVATVVGSIFGQVAVQTDAVSAAAEAGAEAEEALAQEIKEAGNAAKKSLAGFDQLQVLQSGTGNSSGTGSAGAANDAVSSKITVTTDIQENGGAISKVDAFLERLKERMEELAGIFQSGFLSGLGDFGPQLEEIQRDFEAIGSTVKRIFEDPQIQGAAGDLLNTWLYSLGQGIGAIGSVGLTIGQNLIGGAEVYLEQNSGRLKDFLLSMFDISGEINTTVSDFMAAFAEAFSAFGEENAQQITGNFMGIFAEIEMGISESVLKITSDLTHMLLDPFTENQDDIKKAAEGALEAAKPFSDGLLTAVKDIRDAFNDLYDNHLGPMFEDITNGLSDIVEGLVDGYNTYIQPVIKKLGDRFDELMSGPFGDMVEKVKGFFVSVVEHVRTIWNLWLKPLLQWIANSIMPVLAPIIEYIGNTVMNAVQAVITIVGDLAQILGGLIDFVTGMLSNDWEKAWDGICDVFGGVWDFIKETINGIIGSINGLIRGVVGGINSVIGAINGISFTIPSWVPGVGGNYIGFNLRKLTYPQIPYLAQGAVIPPNREFLAVLGDQHSGQNVEAPLSTIQEAVALVMSDMEGRTAAYQEAMLETQRELLAAVLGIQVGDEVIGRAAARYQRRMAVVNGGVL